MNSSRNNHKDQQIQLCQECRRVKFQYQCPRCNFRSCSLPCCLAHKQRTHCTGKRDRTAFVKIGEMSDATLQNDYHFLEDVIERIDSNQRFLQQSGPGGRQLHPKRQQRQSWMKVFPSSNCQDDEAQQHPLLQAARKHEIAPKRFILPVIERQKNQSNPTLIEMGALASNTPSEPKPFHPPAAVAVGVRGDGPAAGWSNLQNYARQRGVTLLRLPPFMERHKRNETRVRNKKIYWTLEWRIYGDSNPDTGRDSVTKTTTVGQTCETNVLYDELCRLVENADGLLSQHLLLLKNELSPANAPKYSKISAFSTLSDALIDQTIIEFPTIHVIPPCRLEEFPLLIQINSDEEAKNKH